jgi:hypothetical protein
MLCAVHIFLLCSLKINHVMDFQNMRLYLARLLGCEQTEFEEILFLPNQLLKNPFTPVLQAIFILPQRLNFSKPGCSLGSTLGNMTILKS